MKIFSTHRLYLWLAIVTFLSLTLIVAYFVDLHFVEKQGTKTKDELINRYITAIRQENMDQILQLIPNNHTLTEVELSQIIINSGGRTLNDFQTYPIPSESPQIEIIKLTGSYRKDGKLVEFTTMLYLEHIDDRWYLLLGRDKNGLPTDAPSSKID